LTGFSFTRVLALAAASLVVLGEALWSAGQTASFRPVQNTLDNRNHKNIMMGGQLIVRDVSFESKSAAPGPISGLFDAPVHFFHPTSTLDTSPAAELSQVLNWWQYFGASDLADAPPLPAAEEIRNISDILYERVPSDAMIWPRGGSDDKIRQPSDYYALLPHRFPGLSHVTLVCGMAIAIDGKTTDGCRIIGMINDALGFETAIIGAPGTPTLTAFSRLVSAARETAPPTGQIQP
jgi:hypothetical protein